MMDAKMRFRLGAAALVVAVSVLAVMVAGYIGPAEVSRQAAGTRRSAAGVSRHESDARFAAMSGTASPAEHVGEGVSRYVGAERARRSLRTTPDAAMPEAGSRLKTEDGLREDGLLQDREAFLPGVSRYENAEIVNEVETVLDDGSIRRVRILRTDMKYPLVRVEESVERDEATGE